TDPCPVLLLSRAIILGPSVFVLEPPVQSFVPLIFFFQAEDGIRDSSVTGVQTCALPISQRPLRHRGRDRAHRGGLRGRGRREHRSEERRVGKECGCRWETQNEKKRSELSRVQGEARREDAA